MRAGWQGCTVRFSTFYAVQQLQYFVLLLLDYHLFCSAKSMMSSSPLFSQWPALLPEFLPHSVKQDLQPLPGFHLKTTWFALPIQSWASMHQKWITGRMPVWELLWVEVTYYLPIHIIKFRPSVVLPSPQPFHSLHFCLLSEFLLI